MKIEEFLDKELICDIDVNGMDSLFSIIAHIFSQKYLSIDKEKLKELLKEREILGTTGIGDGFAIPHTKTDMVDKIIAGVFRNKTGINFNAVDGEPVKIFVVLIAPIGKPAKLLKALAQIAKVSKDKEFRKNILIIENVKDIYKKLITKDTSNS
ncbi:MAG: PTS sugar transporter subunit IIA [Deltaproteobacteria bacterium]|nr:PTS sugar transporter subunit IIA [Deltaproteobacteria bacterium]